MPEDRCLIGGTQNLLALRRRLARATAVPLNEMLLDLFTETTLILIATDSFNRHKTATSAVVNSTTGLLHLTSAQFSKMAYVNHSQLMEWTLSQSKKSQNTQELTANAQLWPRSLNTFIGSTAGKIYLIIGDLGPASLAMISSTNLRSWSAFTL